MGRGPVVGVTGMTDDILAYRAYEEALFTVLRRLCFRAYGEGVQVHVRAVPVEQARDDDEPVFELLLPNNLAGGSSVIFSGEWSQCVRWVRGLGGAG